MCLYADHRAARSHAAGFSGSKERNAYDMKNAKEIVLTPEGLQKLQDELDN